MYVLIQGFLYSTQGIRQNFIQLDAFCVIFGSKSVRGTDFGSQNCFKPDFWTVLLYKYHIQKS